jgi:hypothetical protein
MSYVIATTVYDHMPPIRKQKICRDKFENKTPVVFVVRASGHREPREGVLMGEAPL